jgi:hypothetical protein
MVSMKTKKVDYQSLASMNTLKLVKDTRSQNVYILQGTMDQVIQCHDQMSTQQSLTSQL